jgi:hypothetical protein
VAASAAAAGVALVYAPIATQVADQARRFGQDWGREYGSVAAVGKTIGSYLLRPFFPASLLVPGILVWCGALGILALVVWRREGRTVAGGVLVLSGVAVFFGLCRLQGTPLVRATAFVVVPLAFAGVFFLFRATARLEATPRGILLLAASAILAFRADALAARFHFVPYEAWREMAATLRDTVPPSEPFVVAGIPEFLAGYLAPGYRSVAGLDPGAFVRGEMLCVEAPVTHPPEGRFDGRLFGRDAVEYRIEQRREGYEALWLFPPPQSFLKAAWTSRRNNVTTMLADRNVETATARVPSLWIELEPSHRYRSLVLVTAGPLEGAISAHGTATAGPLDIGPVRRSGGVTLVALRDQEVRLVSLRSRAGRLAPVREVWAYCAP